MDFIVKKKESTINNIIIKKTLNSIFLKKIVCIRYYF